MKQSMTLTPALVLGLLLAGSAAGQATAPKTEERGAVTAQGDAAAAVQISKATATVESIDLATRMVGLVGPDGKQFVVHAGEEVRNLRQVRVGDQVEIEYYEGLVAEMSPPGASPRDVAVAQAAARARPGERPAGAVGKAVTATVVIEYVDTIRNVVHFKGPLGKTRIVKVTRPQFREMLKKLKPGDQVNLTYFETFAVSVQPAKK